MTRSGWWIVAQQRLVGARKRVAAVLARGPSRMRARRGESRAADDEDTRPPSARGGTAAAERPRSQAAANARAGESSEDQTVSTASRSSPCSKMRNAASGVNGASRAITPLAACRDEVQRPGAERERRASTIAALAAAAGRPPRRPTRDPDRQQPVQQMAEEDVGGLGEHTRWPPIEAPEQSARRPATPRDEPGHEQHDSLAANRDGRITGVCSSSCQRAALLLRRHQADGDERQQQRGDESVGAQRGHDDAVERTQSLRERGRPAAAPLASA